MPSTTCVTWVTAIQRWSKPRANKSVSSIRTRATCTIIWSNTQSDSPARCPIPSACATWCARGAKRTTWRSAWRASLPDTPILSWSRARTTETPRLSSTSARISSTDPVARVHHATCTRWQCRTSFGDRTGTRGRPARSMRITFANRSPQRKPTDTASRRSSASHCWAAAGRSSYPIVTSTRRSHTPDMPVRCASQTRCRSGSDAWAPIFGGSRRRESSRISSRSENPSATDTPWQRSSQHRKLRRPLTMAWSISTRSAGIPCRARSVWPCWTSSRPKASKRMRSLSAHT